jgi:hypothetical protein
MMEIKSWMPEVMVVGETKWSHNQLRFATEAEALASARELMGRWMAVTDCRASPSTDDVNYLFKCGKNIPL